MLLYRHRVRREIGEGLVVWINPRRVMLHGGSNQPYTKHLKRALNRLQGAGPVFRKLAQFLDRALYSIEPFTVKGRLLRNPAPIEGEETYRKVDDFIRNRADPARSIWYDELARTLQRTGLAGHKALVFRSEPEILAFLETYVGGLVDSMRARGYDGSKASDIGTGLIAADGTVLKSDAGNHRFCVARILGVGPVPLEIMGAHEDWMRNKQIGGDIGKLRDGLREVEAANQ
jgi:hypothetical protein